jgi:hypothetical protein
VRLRARFWHATFAASGRLRVSFARSRSMTDVSLKVLAAAPQW